MDTPPPPPVEEVAEVADPVADDLRDHVLASCEAARVEVELVEIGRTLADGESLRWVGDPCLPYPRLRAEVFRGPTRVASLPVRARLSLWVRGPTAPRDVQPGEAFEPVPGLVDWRTAQGHPLSGTVQARVPLHEGDAITPRVASRVPDAASGSSVELVLEKGVVRITASGQLTRAAFVGDRVSVRNLATRAVQHGTLVDRTTVVLDP